MARQEIEKYYSRKGAVHTVGCEWSFGCYAIYVDGKHYANADDRLDMRETISELVKNKKWSTTKPQKNTPPMPASSVAE